MSHKPAWRYINTKELVATQQSSALIFVNCVMLSASTYAVFAQPQWLTLIPLATTNMMSLVFAGLAAQSRAHANVDQLDTLAHLRAHSADLARRQRHLRTAYRVLTSGVPLSVLMFGIYMVLAR